MAFAESQPNKNNKKNLFVCFVAKLKFMASKDALLPGNLKHHHFAIEKTCVSVWPLALCARFAISALSLSRPTHVNMVLHAKLWPASKWSGETHLHYPHSSAKHRLQPNGECRSIRWCRVRPSHRTLNSLQKKLFAQAAIFLHSQFDLCTFCGNSTAITRNSFLSRVCAFFITFRVHV